MKLEIKLDDPKYCNGCPRIMCKREKCIVINQVNQQIVSEIVGELEKLKEKYIPEGFTVLGIDECIETIKKMGEK